MFTNGCRSIQLNKFTFAIGSAILAFIVVFEALNEFIAFPAPVPVFVKQVVPPFNVDSFSFHK
jgi:hypothetical protein